MTACAVLFFILTLRAMSKQAQTQIYVKNVEFLTAGYTIPRDRRRQILTLQKRLRAAPGARNAEPRAVVPSGVPTECDLRGAHAGSALPGAGTGQAGDTANGSRHCKHRHDAQSWQPQRPLAWLASDCSASWWQTERRFCWYLTFLCSIGECGATL